MVDSRPRVKPEHAPFRTVDGQVRIGGEVQGVAARIPDPTGSIWSLLAAADGSRTVAQIIRAVRDRHPAETESAVNNALHRLNAAGYLEETNPAPAAPGTTLTDRERERYRRGGRLYQWMDLVERPDAWHVQALLKRSSVTVLGVGGTGSYAAAALAASGVGRLHCVDADRVELSNLNRQLLFTEADIGRDKVTAAIERLSAVNGDITVTGESARVGGVPDLVALAQGCDVLVLAADQPRSIRYWTNEACLRAGVPWVNTGYDGPLVNCAVYLPGNGPCYLCCKLADREQDQHPPLFPAEKDRVSTHAANAVSAGISGQLGAHLAIAALTGVPRITPGAAHGFNLLDLGAHFNREYQHRPDCPLCGDHS